jgi:hypothetical protein
MRLPPNELDEIRCLNDGVMEDCIQSHQLWLHYVGIGGNARDGVLECHLRGRATLPQLQRQLLRIALEEIRSVARSAPQV